ncbi:MAG TPA: hypothetical protein VGK10_07475 [Prolixibacteraceae bacterium]|jgi:hypothetical protein
MEDEELFLKYHEIEKKIIPIKDLLENSKDRREYKGLYKGITTVQSPLVFQPEILFIGRNPGDEDYNSLNPAENHTPLRMIGADEMGLNQLSWYEKGNSRAGKNIWKKWVEYEWYQRNQKTNNPLAKNMIDLLYEVAKLKFPKEYKHQKYHHNKAPFWYEDFGKKIMYTNLYPIASSTINDLNQIHRSLAIEKDLQHLWEESRNNEKYLNNWTVRKYFIKRVEELIDLIQPKIIVCIGITALNDLTYSDNTGSKIYLKEKRSGDLKIPLLGFSRRGNRRGQWNGLIPQLAREIVENQIR